MNAVLQSLRSVRSSKGTSHSGTSDDVIYYYKGPYEKRTVSLARRKMCPKMSISHSFRSLRAGYRAGPNVSFIQRVHCQYLCNYFSFSSVI